MLLQLVFVAAQDPFATSGSIHARPANVMLLAFAAPLFDVQDCEGFCEQVTSYIANCERLSKLQVRLRIASAEKKLKFRN